MSNLVLLPLLGLIGLLVGSFLNVVIVRVPSHESIVKPASHCPLCQATIKRRDNIPVLSWILLRGRCRSCGEPIPLGYPLVELANAALWVVAGLRFGPTTTALAFAAFFSVLLALSVIDLELSILPDLITLPAIVASLVLLPVLAFAVRDDPGGVVVKTLIGGAVYFGGLFLTLIAFELVAGKEGMGFGDVKLAAVLGLWLGWLDPVLVLFALIAASVLGLAVGIVYIAVRRKSMPFPFGPWLAIGAVVAILAAHRILDVYGRTGGLV